VATGEIKFVYCKPEENVRDCLANPLPDLCLKGSNWFGHDRSLVIVGEVLVCPDPGAVLHCVNNVVSHAGMHVIDAWHELRCWIVGQQDMNRIKGTAQI
jgi:hypothetical protein